MKRNRSRIRRRFSGAFTQTFSLVKLIPNLITISALVIGLTSIRFAMEQRWEASMSCIIISALLDGIDGRIARILNASSKFGAELDSLCDFVNFGICPSIIMYLWTFHDAKYRVFSWFIVITFSVCMCIRLARFNTMLSEPKFIELMKKFSLGIPAPVGGILVLLPIILDIDLFENINYSLRHQNIYVIPYMLFISFLVASRIPTFGLKDFKIKHEYLLPAMLFMSISIAALFLYTWVFIPIFSILYLLTIPFSAFIGYKKYFASKKEDLIQENNEDSKQEIKPN